MLAQNFDGWSQITPVQKGESVLMYSIILWFIGNGHYMVYKDIAMHAHAAISEVLERTWEPGNRSDMHAVPVKIGGTGYVPRFSSIPFSSERRNDYKCRTQYLYFFNHRKPLH